MWCLTSLIEPDVIKTHSFSGLISQRGGLMNAEEKQVIERSC